MAVDGIVGAKYLITQLGTPYSKRDCIKAAVVDVIRSCPGGKLTYRIGGCTELWNSIDKTEKYKDVTRRMTLAEAKAEGMLIGDLPVIYNSKTGVCEHIAYYMGGVGGYECLHSSATKGELCPTTLKNGFTHVLRHRYITGRNPADLNENKQTTTNEAVNEMSYNILYTTRVTTSGGTLNMREDPKKVSGNVICEIPNGVNLPVIDDSLADWTKVLYNEKVGYVSNAYLTRLLEVNDAVDAEINTESTGSYGYFIPCSSESEAEALGKYFSYGYVIQHVGDD